MRLTPIHKVLLVMLWISVVMVINIQFASKQIECDIYSPSTCQIGDV